MFMQRIVCFSLGLILTISSTDSFSSYRPSFSVMTYNLENLFDSLHDEGTNDYTFLPLLRKILIWKSEGTVHPLVSLTTESNALNWIGIPTWF